MSIVLRNFGISLRSKQLCHVPRRRSSNEFSSTVLTTGTVLPTVMGCPRRHTSLKLVGGKDYPVIRCPSWLWALFDDGSPRSPPLPSLLAGSRQVAPDGHVAEAQPLGDLSDGQALLAEENRLGTVFVGEAVVAFQSCLPTQPVDR